ncbi:hypothetical protein JCM10207_003636 [Rhodosporidiobolus poonsookiae]
MHRPTSPVYDPLAVTNFPSSRTFAPCAPPSPHPLESYWTAHFASSLTHRNASAPLPLAAEVVIIGSGLTGSCAAAALVDQLISHPVRDTESEVQTTRVVVLEARTFSSGATGRNGGHLTAYPIAHFEALCREVGEEDAVRAVKLEDEAIRWVLETVKSKGWEEDVDLQKGGGTLVLYDSPSQLSSVKASLAAASKAGLDATVVRLVDKAEARRTWGAECEGAIMVPGNNLFPLKFTTKLFQCAERRALAAASAAKEAGAAPPVQLELFTHAVVSGVGRALGVDGDEGRWTVKTARGDIEATHVLHATNGYASSVLPSFAQTPNSHSGILPTRAQLASFLPLSPPPPSSSFANWRNAFSPSSDSPGRGVNTYVFRRAWSAAGEKEGEVIVGGMREHAEGWEWGVSDDASLNEVVGGKIRESVGTVWPRVFELEAEGEKERRGEERKEGEKVRLRVQREWTGIMGYRASGNPVVGPVHLDGEKQDGQWIAAGYSGHGMPRAPPCAHLVASLIHHHLSSSSPSTTPLPSFTLPPHFPRHLLATPDGEGRSTTRLDEEEPEEKEGTRKRRKEKGWVWVEKRRERDG